LHVNPWFFLDQMRVRSEFREVLSFKVNFGFRAYFSPSHYEVFVSTEDAASGIFFQIYRKKG
jgi:hypothetical protein